MLAVAAVPGEASVEAARSIAIDNTGSEVSMDMEPSWPSPYLLSTSTAYVSLGWERMWIVTYQ